MKVTVDSRYFSLEELRGFMKALDKQHLDTVVMSEMEDIVTMKSKLKQEIYTREDKGEV